MEKKKFSPRRGLGLLLIVVILVLSLGTNAFAVTGSQVAKDGTYTGTSTTGKRMSATVTVSNGVITSVTSSDADKSEYRALVTQWSNSLSGKEASLSAVDAVTAATIKKKYGPALKSATLNALSDAPMRDSSAESGEESGTGGNTESGSESDTDTERTVKKGETITLSTGESNYSYYSWISADTSKVTVSGNGSTATVTGVDVTTSPITVTCEYGIDGMTFLNRKKQFRVTIIDSSSSGESEEESEIGKGVGSRTGSKYTGTASINNEYVTLDVYVENNKITGIFIADENGEWLELLTNKWDTYNGMSADSDTVDAVTSSTTRGFETTLRMAISAALANSGSGTETGGSGGENEGGGEEESGEPAHTKAIDPENTVSDEYNITLSVTGQDKKSTTPGTPTTTNKVDVLFIADMSYSMYSTKSNMTDGYGNSRTLDEALRYILSYNSGNSGLIPDILNSSEIDAQVAVVSFSDTATTQTGWTNSKSSAYSAVWNMDARYGNETNVAAGLTEGQTLLNSGREDAAKVVILLSDGDANRPTDEATGKAQAISAARNMSGSVTKFYAIGFNNASSGFMQDIASQFVNYSWKDAGNMSSVASELNAMKGELSSLPAETSVPMSGVVISDTLSDYVELSHADSSDKYGITVKADNADFTDFSVAVSGKKVDVTLNGELTDGTVYTASIPVKPSETAQNEANAKDEAVSEFVSNSGATLTYGYGSDAAKTVYYTETPKILVAKQVTLTYDANGGTSAPEAEKQKVDADTKKASFTISSAEPTRDNYTFLGWAESADADTATYSATAEGMEKTISIDQDKTLYAVWGRKFKVKYEVTGDAPATSSDLPAEATYAVGDDVTIAAGLTTTESTKDNVPGTWTFNGWKNGDTTAQDFVMPDHEVTLTGTWTFEAAVAKYKVNFVNYDDTILQHDSEVEQGAMPEYKGEMPKKPADDQNTYEFSGWKKVNRVEESSLTGLLDIFFMKAIAAEAPLTTGIEPVTEDTTYQAQFTAIPKGYTVTFDTDGGSEAPGAQNVAPNGKATKPENDPTKENMIFDGWTLNGQPYDFDAPVTGDITLTAKWREAYEVTTEVEGHTYEIYQIFTGDLSSTTVGEGDDAATKDILVNLVWGENGTGDKGTAVDENTIQALNDVVGENLDTDKLNVIKSYVNTEGTPVQIITTEEGGTASIDLPAGYYLIRDVPNSQNGNDDATTTYITVVVKNYTVSPKSSKPSVKKEVDNDGTYGQTADYAIGDTVTFKLTAALPADNNYAEYETYKVMFTDTMSEGLTFGEIKSVTVDGKEVTDATKYSATAPDDGSWTLTIDDIKTAAADVNIVDGCEVIVTYTTTLNEKAKATNKSGDYDKNGDVNTNSVKLSYSNDPYATGDGSLGQTTTEDYVWVFTYEVDNTKVNGDTNAALPGAGFRLFKGETEIKLSKDNNGMYYPDASGNEEMISGEDGKFNIRGLDAGTYVLRETTVPGGYNKVDDTEITITATHAEAEENKATLDLGESAVNNTIKNFQGSELPTTGGIGTTIFYIVGGILVIGAGVILITRRRMAG